MRGRSPPYAGGATHYDALGLRPSATHEEVRQAYIERALRHHPDRQEGQDLAGRARAERLMQEANAAWAVLGDRDARAAYDADLGVDVVQEDVRATAGGAGAGTPERVRTGLRRLVPLLVVLALLAAFLVFTAYAGPAPS